MGDLKSSGVEPKVLPFQPSQRLKTLLVGAVAIGILTFSLALYRDVSRAWAAFLTAFVFVAGISLGGFFFVVIQHVSKAGWSASIRRVAEGFGAFFPFLFLGSALVLLGANKLFPWLDGNYLQAHPMVQNKLAYLNLPFMGVRLFVFAALMWWFGRQIVGRSVAQDQTGDVRLTEENVKWSVIWLPVFALGFSFFSVDLLMSLMPTWYSTIFGVYVFAGSFQAALALLAIVLIYLKNRGFIRGFYWDDHLHDVAKFLKGFTIFWAYIAFSQFMLIWYANIPEETEFFLLRSHHGWMTVSLGLLVFKFIIPFLALLPRGWKRNESHLVAVSLIVIATQYLDIFWLVYPNFNDHHLVFGIYELGLLIGWLGLLGLSMVRFYQKHSLVAVKDPRLHEALHHHVTY